MTPADTQYGYKMDFTVRTAYEYAMFYYGAGAEELEALDDQGPGPLGD